MQLDNVHPTPQTAAAPPRPRHWRMSDATFGLMLVVPALLILLAVFAYPLVFSAYTSVHDYDITKPQDSEFVGLDNYIATVQNADFQRALRNSFFYVGLAIPIEFLLGLILAMALATVTRGRGALRTMLIIPMMLAPVTIGLMWKFMYNDQLGIINFILRELGVNRPPLWLSDPELALYSIIVTEVWATVPIFVLLLLAGLLSIPPDYYEAAKIDGAGPFAAFRFITLPLLRPVILVALLIRGMDAFRVFDIVYVMTKGGPALRSDVLSYYLYRTAFTEREFGEATAVGWIMLAILLAGGMTLIGLMRRRNA
jgi:multiple sugar transport system permease protein